MKTIKNLFGLSILLAALFTAFSCENVEQPTYLPNVVVGDGPVDLVDQEFGMYYCDKRNNRMDVYNVVLSNAICFRDGYGTPYLDSEGDMLVFEFNAEIQEGDAPVMLPAGEYTFGKEGSSSKYVNIETSYVKRLVGTIQYHYSIVSGSVTVARNNTGGYDIMTNDMVISYGGESYEVLYSYNGDIKFEEWNKVAVDLQKMGEDIIDMPFPNVSPVYYGNLFGYGTGNYVITFTTADFADDGTAPGVMVTMNMFGKLLRKVDGKLGEIILEEGTYTVYPSFNYKEFSMLYGMDMDGVPFGTYMFQQDTKGTQSLEYIGEGTVDVKRDEALYTLTYEFKTATGRKLKGTWVGELNFADASDESSRLILSTIDGPVACDMSRVEKAYMSHIETLHTTSSEDPIDIAEAWQLWLEPRSWNAEEKDLDFFDRFKVWNPNGDVMILEFVVPLGSHGNIAPEMNKVYEYTIQPNLMMDDPLYVVSTERLGRPYDDIFYEPFWDDYYYMTGWDARRGFTYDSDAGSFRGNWYLHYEEGSWQSMDEHAPAVKGMVKVKRTSEIKYAPSGIDEHKMPTYAGRKADFEIEWELYDDAEPTNKISGKWSGPVTAVTSAIKDEETE